MCIVCWFLLQAVAWKRLETDKFNKTSKLANCIVIIESTHTHTYMWPTNRLAILQMEPINPLNIYASTYLIKVDQNSPIHRHLRLIWPLVHRICFECVFLSLAMLAHSVCCNRRSRIMLSVGRWTLNAVRTDAKHRLIYSIDHRNCPESKWIHRFLWTRCSIREAIHGVIDFLPVFFVYLLEFSSHCVCLLCAPHVFFRLSNPSVL